MSHLSDADRKALLDAGIRDQNGRVVALDLTLVNRIIAAHVEAAERALVERVEAVMEDALETLDDQGVTTSHDTYEDGLADGIATVVDPLAVALGHENAGIWLRQRRSALPFNLGQPTFTQCVKHGKCTDENGRDDKGFDHTGCAALAGDSSHSGTCDRTPHQHGGTDAPECTAFGTKCQAPAAPGAARGEDS